MNVKCLLPINVYAAAAGVYVLDRDHAEPIDVADVKIWNFLGNQGKNVPCNVYLMDVDGVRVADNGDNRDCGKYAGLKGCPPADLIVASTWNRVTDFVGSCRATPGFVWPTVTDLTASNVKLVQMKPEILQLCGRRNVECVYSGAFPFRGSHKGNLRASSGIVAGIAPLSFSAAKQGQRV